MMKLEKLSCSKTSLFVRWHIHSWKFLEVGWVVLRCNLCVVVMSNQPPVFCSCKCAAAFCRREISMKSSLFFSPFLEGCGFIHVVTSLETLNVATFNLSLCVIVISPGSVLWTLLISPLITSEALKSTGSAQTCARWVSPGWRSRRKVPTS